MIREKNQDQRHFYFWEKLVKERKTDEKEDGK